MSNMPELSKKQMEVLGKVTRRSADIRASSAARRTRILDIALLFDTTGSMYPYLENVRQNLSRLVSEIGSALPDVCYAVIAHGDHPDADTTYVTKTCQLTRDAERVTNFIINVEPTGGGGPEALEDALHEANALKWRERSNKAVVLVGDAPPHGVVDSFSECPCGFDYRKETKGLCRKGIKIYSVLCNPNNVDRTEEVFRWFAKQTKGRFLTLENIDDLTDLLIGVCMKEAGLLTSFEHKLLQANKMTPSKRRLMLQLKESGHDSS